MTSRLDTETTLHCSNTQNTETLPNSANISGPLKKITLTTLFHGTSFHQDHPTTAQEKDVTSASKKNYLSSANLIELSIEIYRDAYYADLHNRRGYAYYILYINIYSLWFTLGFMGIKEI